MRTRTAEIKKMPKQSANPNREYSGADVVAAWQRRGGDLADLELILDVILSSERQRGDAYRAHADEEQRAKNRLLELLAKFDSGTLTREDLKPPAPGPPPLPIATIDAQRSTLAQLLP